MNNDIETTNLGLEDFSKSEATSNILAYQSEFGLFNTSGMNLLPYSGSIVSRGHNSEQRRKSNLLGVSGFPSALDSGLVFA
jgi:hypothetical protein